MIKPVLIDSSFLFELNNPKTHLRSQLALFAETEQRVKLVPDVVLTEAVYLIRQRVGQRAAIRFLTTIDTLGFQFEPVLMEDCKIAGTIMSKYHEADFDFVDCCLMAISERLQVTSIYTLDRRDFHMFRPAHCEYFDLLP